MGRGGLSRKAPVGGFAKGIPRKESMLFWLEPTIVPLRVLILGGCADPAMAGITRAAATMARMKLVEG